MSKIPIRLGIIALLLSAIIIFTIAARGCLNRSKTKIGSSNYNTFSFNAPSNLVTNVISSSQINLAWQDNSNNEDGFEIERSTNPSAGYTQLATVAAGINSYSDTTAVLYSTYYYRVRGFTIPGDLTAWSNIASAMTFNYDWLSPSTVIVASDSSFLITSFGNLWSWGRNNIGQLGLGDYDINRIIPNLIDSDNEWNLFNNIKTVAISKLGDFGFTIAIKNDGTLWGWGSNGLYQLGNDSGESPSAPIPIGSDSDWSILALGCEHSFGIKTNGRLFSWGGIDAYGELGQGETWGNPPAGPTEIITSESDWNSVAAGINNSLALKTTGTLWAWGINSIGQLGVGDTNNRNTPTQVTTETDWFRIVSGYSHFFAIKNNGRLFAWGENTYGQLGLGDSGYGKNRSTPTQITTETDWIDITAGGSHSIAIKNNSTLWAWGLNDKSQLGLGDLVNRNTPTQITTETDWSIAIAGFYHSIAVKTNQTIWVWGDNQYGQLGIGDIVNRDIPCRLGLVVAMPSELLAEFVSGTQVNISWVDTSFNETGFKIERKIGRIGTWGEIGSTVANINTYSDISETGFAFNTGYFYRIRSYNASDESPYARESCAMRTCDWAQIVAGGDFVLALKTGGTVWSWGANSNYQLGLGNNNTIRNTPTHVTGLSDWINVFNGGNSGFGIRSNRTLWAWGSNYFGQLGIGSTVNKSTPIQVTGADWSFIAAGSHCLGLKTTGMIWSWGNNSQGQLGFGDTVKRMTPTQVTSETDWSFVAAGTDHSLSIKTDSLLWVWGYNGRGQLGLGDTIRRMTPTQLTIESDWSFIDAGGNSSLGLKTNGILLAWGGNTYGQLGLGDTVDRGTPTQVTTETDWYAIDVNSHSLGIKTNGVLWVWGQNNYGQLGLGDSGAWTNRITPTQMVNFNGWISASAGLYNSVAIKTNGTLWTWGINNQGQSGSGYTGYETNVNSPILIGE